MKQTAKLNYLKIAPRKVRSVADLVRGLPVNEAEAQLLVGRRRAARPLLKLLRSAVANAKNRKLSVDGLYIESFRVDGGPMLKRYLPRARGTATPIQKKMSNVTLILAENAAIKSPRFKIIVPKKVKLPPGVSRHKKDKKLEEEKESFKPKRPGFFKRLFSGKSRAAK